MENFQINKARELVRGYVKDGGDVEKLPKDHPVMKYISGAKIYGPNGKKLTLEEKFNAIGFPRKGRLNAREVVEKAIADFVARTGKPVQEMKSTDAEYKIIKGVKIFDENGNRLSIQQKIEQAGASRERLHSANTREDLIAQVDEYLAQGGSFHVPRSTLPFYEKLDTYRRSLKRNGQDLTTDQVMKSLGYRNYSDIYYRCMNLQKLKDYRDDEGYCDAYRSNPQMKSYILSLAETLQMPAPLVVCLVANENLRRVNMDVDFFQLVKTQLENYNQTYGSLKGIKNNDKTLYSRLRHASRYVCTLTGEEFSVDQTVELLGLGDADNFFRDEPVESKDDHAILEKARLVAQEKQQPLGREDFDPSEYAILLRKSIRYGIPLSEYLGANGIEYNGNNSPRLKKIFLNKYPFLDEMRARRDELMESISEQNEITQEEVFEKNLEFSLQAYDEYKTRIFNFEIEKLENSDRKGE